MIICVNLFPAGGLHLCLEAKTKQKVQGCFLSSPVIFTKPKFKGVISLHVWNFSFSLRFCFDSGLDKNRPIHIVSLMNLKTWFFWEQEDPYLIIAKVEIYQASNFTARWNAGVVSQSSQSRCRQEWFFAGNQDYALEKNHDLGWRMTLTWFFLLHFSHLRRKMKYCLNQKLTISIILIFFFYMRNPPEYWIDTNLPFIPNLLRDLYHLYRIFRATDPETSSGWPLGIVQKD